MNLNSRYEMILEYAEDDLQELSSTRAYAQEAQCSPDVRAGARMSVRDLSHDTSIHLSLLTCCSQKVSDYLVDLRQEYCFSDELCE